MLILERKIKMWLFRKKPKPTIEPLKNYYFTDCSYYNEKFPPNEDELKFFDSLSSKTIGWNKGKFKLERMGDGAISVWLPNGFVGKIRLCKKKHWMMIQTSLYKSKIIEGSVDDFIEHQDSWIKYCKNHL